MTSPSGTVTGTLLASLTAARHDAVRYCQGRSGGRAAGRPPSSGAAPPSGEARKRERKRATAFLCSRPFPMPPLPRLLETIAFAGCTRLTYLSGD
ncbi:unnamed protein product [Musa hybrid cultivar]